jgi:Cys-tRNA(Pro) deacylase
MASANSLTTPVTKDLDALGVSYRIFTHPGQVRSLEQAAQERGQSPKQVVRSILFRLPGQEFVMVLVSGPDQISWADLRRHLGVSRITMATTDEVLQATGYLPGSVAPFGLPAPIRTLIDRRVFDQQEVSLGSGVRNTTIILRSEELRRALGEAEVGCFVSCPE